MSYRKIDPRMWDDEWFAYLSTEAKLLWVFILTGPHTTNLPGLSKCGIATMAESSRMDVEKVKDALAELLKTKKVEFDEARRIVRVPKAPTYNPPENKFVLKGWYNQWTSFPDCPLKFAHIASLKAGLDTRAENYASVLGAWEGSFGKVSETVSETISRQSQESPKDDPGEESKSRPSHTPSDRPSTRPSQEPSAPSPPNPPEFEGPKPETVLRPSVTPSRDGQQTVPSSQHNPTEQEEKKEKTTESDTGVPSARNQDSVPQVLLLESIPPEKTTDQARTSTGGGQEGVKKVTDGSGNQGGSKDSPKAPAEAPRPSSEGLANEPALQAVFRGSDGRMEFWEIQHNQTLGVDFHRRLNSLIKHGLKLEHLYEFGQWINAGGPDGKGGFSWMNNQLPAWSWILQEKGRLEGFLMIAKDWARTQRKNAHKFIPKEPEKPESEEERQARFKANREYREKHPLDRNPSPVETKPLGELPKLPDLPDPFAAHKQKILEETQERCKTKEAAKKEQAQTKNKKTDHS